MEKNLHRLMLSMTESTTKGLEEQPQHGEQAGLRAEEEKGGQGDDAVA